MNHREEGLRRGRAAGEGAKKGDLHQQVLNELAAMRILYPTIDFDLAQALINYDRERLACDPDYRKFPELRGHLELLRAEREGFKEVSGLGDLEAAFTFSWWFFMMRRLNGNHLARWDLVTAPGPGCTNVFIPGGRDGVTISDNRDIALPDDMTHLANLMPERVFQRNLDSVYWVQGGVSAAVLLDDEPACSFPADPFSYQHLIPPECFDDIDVMIEFMTRYNEFYGPGNKILVDRHLNAVAMDKSNCKVAFRKPTVNGAIAVTACAYLDPELSAHQLARAAKAAEMKGDSLEESLDYNYHAGSRKRYQRLVDLTDAAAKGQPTIWDALEVVADHAVPYPDRVCLAGESRNSAERNPKENWSVTQHAAVITGPHRRALYRSIQSRQHPKPVYDYTPKLMLGPGAQMQLEWQAEIDAGKCSLGPSFEESNNKQSNT
jgi:hypothetical protein